MDELLELLLWALIVGFGWLWSAARDRGRTRRPTARRPPTPTSPSPEGSVRPAPARRAPSRQPSDVTPARRREAPVGTATASAATEESAEGAGLEWAPATGAVAEASRPSLLAEAPSTAFGTRRPWQIRGARAMRLVPVGADELVRAVVMAEVLGPPRALRSYRRPGSSGWRAR